MSGVSWPLTSEPLDLARDLPTTAEDILALARSRASAPSWLPAGQPPLDPKAAHAAAAARPSARAEWTPFVLP
jgi:hypothetical protein